MDIPTIYERLSDVLEHDVRTPVRRHDPRDTCGTCTMYQAIEDLREAATAIRTLAHSANPELKWALIRLTDKLAPPISR